MLKVARCSWCWKLSSCDSNPLFTKGKKYGFSFANVARIYTGTSRCSSNTDNLITQDAVSSGSLQEKKEHVKPKSPLALTSPETLNEKVLKPCIIEESGTMSTQKREVPTASKLLQYYSLLSKYRLTSLVVWSAVTGYAMAPLPTDILTLSLCLTGTALTSAAANTINQFFEVPFDSQMARTSNRVLVRGLISPLHAVSFATVSGTTGLAMLYFGVNSICAALGALTLVLYTLVYTPMKRTSIANTWVGSVVGALPPLMGYAGCTGYLDAGALVLASVLYAWQFPHFNALSWNLRGDYSRAGYRMMAVTDPELCRKTTLRYSLAMIGICSAAPLVNLTSWSFALDSLPVNLYLVLLSYRFYQNSDSSSSRKLFRYSLLHLPAIMMLMLLHKKKDDDSQDKLLKTIVNYLISNE